MDGSKELSFCATDLQTRPGGLEKLGNIETLRRQWPQYLLLKSVALAPFLRYMEETGAPVDQLVVASGLSRELLSRPDSLVSTGKVYGMLHRCRQYYGSEFWSVEVGRSSSYTEMGAYGAIIERSLTVREFLAKGALLYSNLNNSEKFTLSVGENSAYLFHEFADSLRQPTVYGVYNGLALIIGKCREALGPDWCPRKIGVAHAAPALGGVSHEFAGSPIDVFSGRNYIEFELHDLDACFPQVPGGLGLLSSLADAELDAMPDSLADIVADHLGSCLDAAAVSIRETAHQLNISVRSLQRRLAEEGLTYRGFINELRYQMAVDRLAVDNLPIAELAHELGYTDAANFTRAFRARSGISPRKYRLKLKTN